MNTKIFAALATLTLACKPEPATQPPAEPTPAPVAPEVTGPPTSEPPNTMSGEPMPAEPGTATTVATTAGSTEPAPAIDAGPAPTPASNKEPLPAALSTKIDARCGNDPGVGTAAKPFNLKTPEGKDISLASHRGKVVLLNFWGTWCKPCLKELPEFDRLYRRYRKNGLVVIAIATDTEPEKVQEFAAERKLATKLALGGQQLADDYESSNFPFSFVIDGKGQIRGSYRGYKPECAGKLEQDIRTQLEQLK
ncbi:MAG TPA: redoxin domain-containing protein [Nannocystis sp.]|jgi:peroxiredoxin